MHPLIGPCNISNNHVDNFLYLINVQLLYSFSKLCSSSQYVTHGYTADFVRLRLPAAWWVSRMSHILRNWIHTAAFLNTIYFFIPYTFLTPNNKCDTYLCVQTNWKTSGQIVSMSIWYHQNINTTSLYNKNICSW